MSEFSLTQEAMSHKVGKDRASVANHLRILRLPEKIRAWLKENTLSFGHGKALASLTDQPADAERFAEEAIDQRWSVRELEQRIQAWKDGRPAPAAAAPEAPLTPMALRLQNVGKELSQKYSTKVVIKGHEKRGKIVLEYYSAEDLNRLIEAL
jgi:ParB family chromosome partitioning protein